MLIHNAVGLQIRPSGEEGKGMAYKDGKLVNTLPANAQPGMTDKAELERKLKNEEKK